MKTSFGSEVKILKEYKGYDEISNRTRQYVDVIFIEYNWIKIRARKDHIKNIKCPYEPRVYGIGCVGEGIYSKSKNEKIYHTWKGVLERCYDKKLHEKHPTYIGCEVCDEWLNFQNFAKWYEENYYEIEGQRMNLDKDILMKGNKVYSPKTCVFVPQRINKLFTKNDNDRGDLPIGVSKENLKYLSSCKHRLGLFDNPHDAFLMYKLNKELIIEEVANEYKDKIPKKLYEAMINYEVEEND